MARANGSANAADCEFWIQRGIRTVLFTEHDMALVGSLPIRTGHQCVAAESRPDLIADWHVDRDRKQPAGCKRLIWAAARYSGAEMPIASK